MTPEELAKKELIERLKDIADQLAYASYPYCEWADDVRIAAKKLEINFITLKNI
jgi:hypothetical protein